MVVFVPGLLGSQLLRPDGSVAWLNLGNTLGHHDLSLPRKLPFAASRDELAPGFLIGTDSALPRAFGFTEYADLLDLLDAAGYEPGAGPACATRSTPTTGGATSSRPRAAWRCGSRGWRARSGDPGARFHLVGHSMGGLVVRWYLRYGGAEPDENAPVTWAGARRTASVLLTATPNAGSIPALGAISGGERVGLSHTTLAAVGREPHAVRLPAAAALRHAAARRSARARARLRPARPRDLGALRLGAVRPGLEAGDGRALVRGGGARSGRARSTPGSRAGPTARRRFPCTRSAATAC